MNLEDPKLVVRFDFMIQVSNPDLIRYQVQFASDKFVQILIFLKNDEVRK